MKKGRLQEGLFRRKDQWVLICGFTTTEWSSSYKTYLEVSSLLFVGPSSLMTKRHSMHICGRGECSPFLPFFYVLRSSSFFLLRKHLWHGWPQCVVGFFDLLAKWPTSADLRGRLHTMAVNLFIVRINPCHSNGNDDSSTTIPFTNGKRCKALETYLPFKVHLTF